MAPAFKVEIGPQQIYDKLIQMDEKQDLRYTDQAVTNAKFDGRLTALERTRNYRWHFWTAIAGGAGGVLTFLISLLQHK